MEFKIFSTVHPDYFALIVSAGGETKTLDTTLLNKTLTKKDKSFQNHESVENILFKLSQFQSFTHPYQEWLYHFLGYALKTNKDCEVLDRTYWEVKQKPYKFLGGKKEKKATGVHKIEFLKEMSKNFISLDVETTGLNTAIDSIIQFSAVKYQDGKEVDRFDTFVKPSNNKVISEFTTELTGITPEDVASAPVFASVWEQFLSEFYQEEQLVGQNLIFDLNILESECKRANVTFEDFVYADTLSMSKKLLPNLGRGQYKLEELKKKLLPESVSALDSHNSLNDCLIAGELYLKLLSMGG